MIVAKNMQRLAEYSKRYGRNVHKLSKYFPSFPKLINCETRLIAVNQQWIKLKRSNQGRTKNEKSLEKWKIVFCRFCWKLVEIFLMKKLQMLKNKMKSSTSKKVKFPSLRRNQKSESTKKARNIFNIFHNDHYWNGQKSSKSSRGTFVNSIKKRKKIVENHEKTSKN